MATTEAFSPQPATGISPARAMYVAASALLSYPDDSLPPVMGEIRAALRAEQIVALEPLLQYLGGGELIDLQENYVATFDRRTAHSLHLFEHIHGESRDRGQALIDLRQEYLNHGLLPDTNELPDYIPLFLEFLGQIPEDDAQALLDEAIHVLARVGDKLSQAQSPYAVVFTMLRSMSTVQAEPLPEPSEGEFEEKAITFGPDKQGLNPAAALGQAGNGVQPVTFYARDGRPRTLPGAAASGLQ